MKIQRKGERRKKIVLQPAKILHLHRNWNLAKVKQQILNTREPAMTVSGTKKLYFVTQETLLTEQRHLIARI